MKTTKEYSKPQIEIITVESEGVMADSIKGEGVSFSSTGTHAGGDSRSKDRSFWE